MAAAKSSIVVGGGFVGVSCALHLQRIGRRVTLLDRFDVGAAAAASYGNAGTMACYANVPTNNPGLLRKLPAMLADADGPLSIAWDAHLVKMAPWALLFAEHCRRPAVDATSRALGALLARAEAGYDGVWRQAGVDPDAGMGAFCGADSERPFASRGGYLLLQRTPDAMRDSEAGAALRRAGVPGLKMTALSRDEVLKLEPNVSSDVCEGGAWYFEDGWFLSEPAALLRALLAGFEENGGEFANGDAVALGRGADGRPEVRLASGDVVTGDDVVVAAGAHSKPLVESLGEWCPLDTERGYHVAFPGAEAELSRAVCDPAAGFIMSPMAGGLRAAGKVELGGLGAPLDVARCDALERGARMAVPSLGPRDATHDWLGFRPTMPDALPVIGLSKHVPSVIYAFGHQHVGWTLGGITGQLVAELADGVAPSVDLTPYRLDRFGGSLLGRALRASTGF
mmetsp:Transcript_22715/g.70236  ORF Transcript_22715/g.70236 Transcript_22715/m.70236 type:complete len:454 (+) Transcript_22715:204-1565(+)